MLQCIKRRDTLCTRAHTHTLVNIIGYSFCSGIREMSSVKTKLSRRRRVITIPDLL